MFPVEDAVLGSAAVALGLVLLVTLPLWATYTGRYTRWFLSDAFGPARRVPWWRIPHGLLVFSAWMVLPDFPSDVAFGPLEVEALSDWLWLGLGIWVLAHPPRLLYPVWVRRYVATAPSGPSPRLGARPVVQLRPFRGGDGVGRWLCRYDGIPGYLWTEGSELRFEGEPLPRPPYGQRQDVPTSWSVPVHELDVQRRTWVGKAGIVALELPSSWGVELWTDDVAALLDRRWEAAPRPRSASARPEGSPLGTATAGAAAVPSPPEGERWRFPVRDLWWLLAAAAAFVLVSIDETGRGPGDAHLRTSVTLAVLGVVLVAVLARVVGISRDGLRVEVDRSGLRLGHRRLPAEELGEVRLVEPDEVADSAWEPWSAFRRWWVGRAEVPPRRRILDHGGAPAPITVLVEQRRPGRGSRWWLVHPPDARRFASAIAAVSGPDGSEQVQGPASRMVTGED
jgi:hypothetical protein